MNKKPVLLALQSRCEEYLRDLVDTHGLCLSDLSIEGVNELYIVTYLPSVPAKLWIYTDSLEITAKERSYIFEAHDYADETLLIEAFIAAVRDLINGCEPSDKGSNWRSIFRDGPV